MLEKATMIQKVVAYAMSAYSTLKDAIPRKGVYVRKSLCIEKAQKDHFLQIGSRWIRFESEQEAQEYMNRILGFNWKLVPVYNGKTNEKMREEYHNYSFGYLNTMQLVSK